MFSLIGKICGFDLYEKSVYGALTDCAQAWILVDIREIPATSSWFSDGHSRVNLINFLLTFLN